jgi:4-hydroxy-tetrahydrodipicolinate reductase
MSRKRYRVAQWGTGHSGRRALQAVIGHPLYDLVGVRVYNQEKVGKDAGEICGLAPTGVRATSRLEDIITAKPDCLLYFPATGMASVDDLCAILESGANVVTLLSEFYYPPSLEPDVRRRIEAACEKGKASLYATGPDPGFATSTLALGAISFQRRLDRVRLYEFANMSSRTAEMNKAMWGWEPSERSLSAHAGRMRQGFGEAWSQTAAAIGLPLDNVTAEGLVAVATQAVDIACMTIEKGTVAGCRFEVTGWRKGEPLVQFYSTWWVTEHIDKDWELRDRDGWRLVVDGDTPLDISVLFAPYAEVGNSSGYNAHICVNAIPSVYQGRPGILTPSDLPPIVAQFA